MIHPNFYRDHYNGEPVYRCCECKYDSFSLPTACDHARFRHPQRIIRDLPGNIPPARVTVGFLTWNTLPASQNAAWSLLDAINAYPTAHIAWFDNGSDDGTRESVESILLRSPNYRCFHSLSNIGQSAARNWIIDMAIANQSDYLLLVDGDIALIPGSIPAMVGYLSRMDRRCACFGMLSYNCSADPDDQIAERMGVIDNWMVRSSSIAWTQYGLFRVQPFREGLRFDEGPFFQGPGWGFEDDDLYLQMVNRGLVVHHTPYFRYLHRSRNSSIALLTPERAILVFEERKSYLISKWSTNPSHTIRAHITRLANQNLPVLHSA